jgi:transposase
MDKRFLEECLAQDMSLEAIGEVAGKHPSTVGYWLKRYGLTAAGSARHAPKGGVTRAELEPLVEEGLTIEGIAQRLGVGDTTVRRWLAHHDLATQGARRRTELTEIRKSGQRDIEVECKRHGLTRHVTVPSERRLRCTRCRAEAVSRRRRKVKEMLVTEAGGKCVLCGYARHLAALQFHHVDPATKSFGLGVRGITRSIARLREEASKCVLLCANCHAELEVGAVELPVKCGRSTPVRSSFSD